MVQMIKELEKAPYFDLMNKSMVHEPIYNFSGSTMTTHKIMESYHFVCIKADICDLSSIYSLDTSPRNIDLYDSLFPIEFLTKK